MNEKQLRAAVNRPLKDIHIQSMTGVTLTYGGTPDGYYDGPERDAWIEFKMLSSMPRSGTWSVYPDAKRPQGKLTMLQYRWLLRRYTNGGNAFVIVGLPNKTAILLVDPEQWKIAVPLDCAKPLRNISAWIQEFCGGSSAL